jgi:hypothetical protein
MFTMGAIAISAGFLFLLNAYAGAVQTLSQIAARSERVEFRVTQPRLAAFHVRGMRIATSPSASPRDQVTASCLEGLITPAMGSRVIYGRVGYGSLSIELLPPIEKPEDKTITGTVSAQNGNNERKLLGRTYLESNDACDHEIRTTASAGGTEHRSSLFLPLPIWGMASIGAEFSGADGLVPQPRFLLEGKLTLSAHAIALPAMQPTLYQVTEVDLPIASRVEAFSYNTDAKTDPAGEKARQGANWWGSAYVEDGKPALNVALATDVPRLAIYRPNRHDPDVIESTILAQMFGDPNLIKLYKLLALIVGTGTFTVWLVEAIEILKTLKRASPTDNEQDVKT